MAFACRREDIIRREMESAWRPPSPKTELPGYDAEADPFCPLGVARRFNHLQREAATKGTQSLIDLRPGAGKLKAGKSARGTLRPSTSRVCTLARTLKSRDCRTDGNGQLDPSFLAGAGAVLRLRDGGGFAGVRRPPLVGKGLPSATQVNDGIVRGAKRRCLADKVSSSRNGMRKSSPECTRGTPIGLGASAKQDFEARIARRGDLLQGEGMRSFREAVAQDANFADGIPEASAWLGFSTRRNPLFLPPKGKTLSPDIGLDSADEMDRFRDAQEFILNVEPQDATSSPHYHHSRGGIGIEKGNGGDRDEAGKRSASKFEASGKGILLGDRVRVMNAQLATARETMRNLEVSLRSMEAERERGRGKVTGLREAAAAAGGKKLVRKMYRLRGAAACVEEGLERLEGEITAVRVRLFAERLLIRGASAPAHKTTSDPIVPISILPPDEGRQQKQHRFSAAAVVMIQARYRGARSRTDPAEATTIKSEDRTRDEAATRIEATARGNFMRNRVAAKRSSAASEARKNVGQVQEFLGSRGEGYPSRKEEARKEHEQPRMHTASSDPDNASESDSGSPKDPKRDNRAAAAATTAAAGNLPALETLGPVGVKAFFDSLGLGACAEHLRIRQTSERRKMESKTELQPVKSLDGSDLAKIARAPDPDAELLAVGVSARLHRVKVMTALGIKDSGDRLGAECAPSRGGNASSRISNNGLLNNVLGEGRPAVAAAVAMHMIRRLRQDQEVIVDALRGLTTSKRARKIGSSVDIIRKQFNENGSGGRTGFQKSVDSPLVLTGEYEDVDRASGDASAIRKASGSGGEVEVFLVPLRFLPELEEAVSISYRARELLEISAASVQTSEFDDQPMNQAMDAADANVGSTLEP